MKSFEIERMNRFNQWENIGSIVPKKYNNEKAKYQFIDYNPLQGNNYYRLKLIENDGNYTYSLVRVVKIESDQQFSFSRINEDAIKLNTTQPLDWSKVNIKLISGEGKIIIDQVGHSTINLNGLLSAWYVLIVDYQGERSTYLFIK